MPSSLHWNPSIETPLKYMQGHIFNQNTVCSPSYMCLHREVYKTTPEIRTPH